MAKAKNKTENNAPERVINNAPERVIRHDRKLVSVQLQGTAPMLMNRMTETAMRSISNPTTKIRTTVRTPFEVATDAAYIDEATGELYFPGTCISRMCAEVGAGMKQAGTRKTLKWSVGGGLTNPDRLNLFQPKYDENGMWDGASWEPARRFDVDSRTVVNAKTKGRMLCHRPRIPYWRAEFDLIVNESVLDVGTVHKMLIQAGETNGLGDFRPQKMGSFGTFLVTKFEVKLGYDVPEHTPPTYRPDLITPEASRAAAK